MRKRVKWNIKPPVINDPPSVCPKCQGSLFVNHEDGWQCWNCMKIVYQSDPLPLINNNRPARVGPYRGAKQLLAEQA